MSDHSQRERVVRAGQPSQDGNAQTQPRGQTLEQKRASKAWEWVEKAEKLGRQGSARYATLARKLPGYLQVSGLAQTMAFLFSKAKGGDKGPEGLLFHQLGLYLVSNAEKHPGPKGEKSLMDMLLDLSPAEYRQATREAMAVAGWLKRFAAGAFDEASE